VIAPAAESDIRAQIKLKWKAHASTIRGEPIRFDRYRRDGPPRIRDSA
jgi:hypothetical protein